MRKKQYLKISIAALAAVLVTVCAIEGCLEYRETFAINSALETLKKSSSLAGDQLLRALPAGQHSGYGGTITCDADTCNYGFTADNKRLSQIGLAHPQVMNLSVKTNNGRVTEWLLLIALGRDSEYGFLRVENVQSTVGSCGEPLCVVRKYRTKEKLASLYIFMSPILNPGERDKVLKLNTGCIDHLGGCSDIEDVLNRSLTNLNSAVGSP